MKYFVFRNMTIERFFQNMDASFSGYEDISFIDTESDRYIWFYMPSIKTETSVVAEEIRNYIDLLRFTLSQITPGKLFIVFTMHEMYSVKTITSNNDISKAISSYNNSIYELANSNNNIKIIDFSTFLNRFSINELIDWKYYFISQMALNPRLSNSFQEWLSIQIRSIELNRKKCLILDLDNTLWGGVLGEDGIEGISLGGDYPGKAFSFFQHQIEELGKHGIILCVCSKNNIEDVKELWEKHTEVILKEEHFAVLKINWINKADNIRQLAEELNIGLDSMVFIDDNPAERELVKTNIPEVEVPEFPEQPYHLPAFFKEIAERYFAIYSLTTEDLSKTEQYKQNAQRESSKKLFTNMDDYIKSLNIEIHISQVNNITLQRVSQLTQKTNQFNLTTYRYTDADIKHFIQNNARIFTLSVSDKFGDYGLTGVCISVVKDNIADFDTLLLSCRILGKRIEEAYVYYILKELKEDGIKMVKAKFIPSAKNLQVKDFYEKFGFNLLSEKEGIKEYKLDLIEREISLLDNYSYK